MSTATAAYRPDDLFRECLTIKLDTIDLSGISFDEHKNKGISIL